MTESFVEIYKRDYSSVSPYLAAQHALSCEWDERRPAPSIIRT
jgi:hypothetical protein